MYEKMYHILFKGVTDAMDMIETQDYQAALIRLEQASREAEKVYISFLDAKDGPPAVPTSKKK